MTYGEFYDLVGQLPHIMRVSGVEFYRQYLDSSSTLLLEEGREQIVTRYMASRADTLPPNTVLVDYICNETESEKKCTCDFVAVILVTGCTCGGK